MRDRGCVPAGRQVEVIGRAAASMSFRAARTSPVQCAPLLSEFVDEAPDTVLQMHDMEVDEQAELVTTELQVGEKLRIVHRK